MDGTRFSAVAMDAIGGSLAAVPAACRGVTWAETMGSEVAWACKEGLFVVKQQL